MIMLLNLLGAGIILCCGIGALNRMSHETHHGVRTGWVALTVSAAAILLSAAQPSTPEPAWAQILFEWSVVALVWSDRRAQRGRPA